MTPLLALVALAAQEAPVTFAHRAAPTPVVVKALGEKMGQTITADPPLTDVDLYLNVADLPVETLFAKVAHATGGTWKTTPKGRHLAAGPRKSALDAERVAAAQKEFDKAFPVQTADKPWTVAEARQQVDEALKTVRTLARDDYQAIDKFRDTHPGGRLTSRVVRSLGLRELLSVLPGQRVVWSSSPTASQRPLPPAALAAIAAYNAEVRSHATALEEANVTDEDRSTYWMPLLQPSREDEAEGVMVAVKQDFGNMTVSVRLLGSDGYSRWQSWLSLVSPNSAEPAELPFTVPQEPLVLSDRAKTLTRAGQRAGATPDPEALKALRAEFEALESSDLPGVVPSDLFDQTARTTELDIVAAFPFAFGVFTGPILGAQETSLKKAWQSALSGMRFFTAEVDNSVLTVTGNTEMVFFVEDITRLTAALAARVVKDGKLSLEEAVSVAVASKNRGDLFGASLVFQFAYPEFASQASQALGERSLLRMYGLLDENSKRQARNGGANLRFSALPPRIAQEYRALVFFDQPGLSYSSNVPNPQREADEPTIGLANGFPANGTVTIKFETPTGVLGFTEFSVPGYSYSRTMNPGDIASSIAWAEVSGEGQERTTYAVASYEKLTVSGLFGAGLSHEASATMIPSIPADQRLAWDKLPAETKAEIEKHLAENRKAFAEYRGRVRPTGRIRP